jgi:LytS/YehU family sensor histidine kinase
MIPKLLLQPLAENAFKYGFSDRTEDGVLEIKGLRKKRPDLLHRAEQRRGHAAQPAEVSARKLNGAWILNHGRRAAQHRSTLEIVF